MMAVRWMLGSVLMGLMLNLTAAGQQPAAAPQAKAFHNHKMVSVEVSSQRDLLAIMALDAEPWNCITGVGGRMEFSFAPEAFETFLELNIPHEIRIENIQPLIESDVSRMQEQIQNQEGIAGGEEWFADFKPWPVVNEYLEELAALRPDLAETFIVGTTHEGRPIHGIRITGLGGGGVGAEKPAVFFNSLQHAREWVVVMVTMYIADALIRRYDTDPQIHDLMDRVEFFIVPIVNPDGYEFSYAAPENRLWRKNRRDNGDGTFGVDLNRNWSVDWNGGQSTSTNPASDVYVGPSAFSEPETSSVRDFITARPQIAAHIDFHSYGQLVLQAYGHTNQLPPDYNHLDGSGTAMNEAANAVHGEIYENGSGGTLLYLASGTFKDWSYGEQQHLSSTVEVRDNGQFGFVLPPDHIIPTCQEHLPVALQLAEWVARGPGFFFNRGLPAVVNSSQATPISLHIEPLPGRSIVAGSAKLWHRVGGSGPFSATPLNPVVGTMFSATLPAAVCGDWIEYYFEVEDGLGASFTSPPNAPDATHHALAADQYLYYNFEGPPWSTQNNGATAGLWQHGVPVNDPNWSWDPYSDADGSGRCYLTGNAPGNSDLDNGSVLLYSPQLNLTNLAGDAVISYAYFLHLAAAGTSDMLRLEISANGATGPWTELARHENSGSAHWRYHSIHQSQLTSLGVTLTSNMRLRFIATDANPQTIVEAGVDAVRVSIDCGPPPPACPADIAPEPNGNGTVNVDDLLYVINHWGPCPPMCQADIAPDGGDGAVGVDDLQAVINAWGDCK